MPNPFEALHIFVDTKLLFYFFTTYNSQEFFFIFIFIAHILIYNDKSRLQ